MMSYGENILAWSEKLAQFSEPAWAEKDQLTCTYLTPAHIQTGAQIEALMIASGFDEVSIDAVGNVVGIYLASDRASCTQTLLTGSHYDTVRNGGKYDGRLGILVPVACVADLVRQQRRLPFNIEVIGFAEEEGQRFRATFLAAGAVTGTFDPAWLEQTDTDGITMRQAMLDARLPGTMEAIEAIKRDPSRYAGFVEVHIEQGPVLCEGGLPLGVVTSINAGIRGTCSITGLAAHAGTTPMTMRSDALLAGAEISLMAEKRALADGDSVATVGQMQVPGGSINVIPGQCLFTLDMRAPQDAQRAYIEQLERSGLVEEWMIRQASRAVDLYQKHYLRFRLEQSGEKVAGVSQTGVRVHAIAGEGPGFRFWTCHCSRRQGR